MEPLTEEYELSPDQLVGPDGKPLINSQERSAALRKLGDQFADLMAKHPGEWVAVDKDGNILALTKTYEELDKALTDSGADTLHTIIRNLVPHMAPPISRANAR